jgi:hypothetical protein
MSRVAASAELDGAAAGQGSGLLRDAQAALSLPGRRNRRCHVSPTADHAKTDGLVSRVAASAELDDAASGQGSART